jgi:hypothetical protein
MRQGNIRLCSVKVMQNIFTSIHLVLSKILPINFSCTYIRLHQIMRYYTFNSAPERNSVVVTLRFEGEQNKMISCDNRHYYFVIYIRSDEEK